MKKLSLLVALIAIILGGCTKNYYGGDATNPPYRVDGITDFTVSEDNPRFFMDVQLVYMNNEQENVTVTVEDLPAGLYANYQNNSGIPSFYSRIDFYDSSAAPGTYNVKVVTNGSVSGRRTYPFKITVNPIADCKNDLTGSYSAQNFCAVGVSNFTETVAASPTVARRILINNFENAGFQIYANLSCNTQSITIPSQTVNGATYSGSGYFYTNTSGDKTLYIYYNKVYSGGGSVSCNLTLEN